MTRFYLKQKEDPHGPSISLFVGNLPTGLAQRQYEKLLLDFITPGQLFCRVLPVVDMTFVLVYLEVLERVGILDNKLFLFRE
jgi:hypothetical protein